MAQECERLAPSGNAEHELESSELLACNLFHQGSFARALEYAERGVALFESGGAPGGYTTFPATLGDNAGVSCHDWAGLALWFLGRPDRALARATRALELARDPSRAYSLATARAQMAVVHQCRREPEAALEWAEATIAAAQQLGYVYREAMGRVLRGWALALLGDAPPGRARDHRRAGRVARHRRAHGRPALPRAARRGAPARGRARRRGSPRSPRRSSSRGASARCSTSPSCTGSTARCTPPPAAADARGGVAAARPRPGARAGLHARSSCGSRPTWRGCSPTRPRAAEARAAVAAVARRLRGGLRARATCATPRPCSSPPVRRSRRRRRAPARARRARRGRRRTPPSSGARASAAGTRSTRSRRRTRRSSRGSSARRPAPSSSPILRSSNRPEITTAGTESRNE